MKIHTAPYFIFVLLGIMGCENQEHHCEFTALNQFSSLEKHVEYQYIRDYDYRFNNTTYSDTSNVRIIKTGEGEIQLHIFTKGQEEELLYKSNKLITLNHFNRSKTVEEIKNTDELVIGDVHLLGIVDILLQNSCDIKPIPQSTDLHLLLQDISMSKVDTNELVITETEYIFPKNNINTITLLEKTIKGTDTLSINHHYLTDIRIQGAEVFQSINHRFEINSYPLIETNDDLPFGKKAIREGAKLTKKAYTDIEGNSIQLLGHNNRYSIILFSFIGCAPCEIAIQQLIEDQEELLGKVNLYYSSFQNTNASLRPYLENKEIFKNAFGKESKMIDEFRLPVSPTFVIIDQGGRIKHIIEGFDNTVLSEIKHQISP